jgi:hypothetical protein
LSQAAGRQDGDVVCTPAAALRQKELLRCFRCLIEANFGLFDAHANGGGVAFFAHVGGFIFGLLAARLLARGDRPHRGSSGAPRRSAGDAGADRPRIRYSQY